MNRRRTLVCLFVDNKKKEFCIRNRNSDYFGIDFIKYFDIIYSDELTVVENVVRLNKFFGSDNFEVIDILSAENHYNRDQKEINKFKNYEISIYENKGYTWNEELDNFIIPTYNDNEENKEIIESITNYRNLSTLYKEKLEAKKKEFSEKIDSLDKQYSQKVISLNNIKEDIAKQSDRRRGLIEENDTLETEISDTSKKLAKLKSLVDDYSVQNDVRIKEAERYYTEKIDKYKKEESAAKERHDEAIAEYSSNIEKYKEESCSLKRTIDAYNEEIAKMNSEKLTQAECLKMKIDNQMYRELFDDIFCGIRMMNIKNYFIINKNTNPVHKEKVEKLLNEIRDFEL